MMAKCLFAIPSCSALKAHKLQSHDMRAFTDSRGVHPVQLPVHHGLHSSSKAFGAVSVRKLRGIASGMISGCWG